MTFTPTRRQLLTLAGLGAGTAALAACGGPQTTPDSGGDASSAAQTDWSSVTPASEITFWSNHPGASEAVETEIIDAFNSSGAGITVSMVTAGANYEEVAQRFQTQQAAGELPDLVIFSDVWWFRYYMQSSIMPLDSILDTAGIDAGSYVQGLWGDYTYDGQQWAVPYARSTPLFYYNKEHWAAAGLPDRAPETWEEFADWAPQLMDADLGIQAAYQLPALAGYAGWVTQNNLWGWGGGWSAEDSFDITTDSDQSLAAMQFLQDAVYADKWAAVAAQSAADDVAAGAASATIESTGSLVGFQQAASFELGVGFLPGGPEVQQPVCPTGGAGLGIPAEIEPERQLAAATFLAFMTNPENTAKFAGATGYMPVRTDADTSAIISANPAAEVAINQLERIRPQDFARVFIPGADQEMANACGDMFTQQADVAETMGSLRSTLEQLYARDVEPNL